MPLYPLASGFHLDNINFVLWQRRHDLIGKVEVSLDQFPRLMSEPLRKQIEE
jgi:hypothetical protein